MLVTFEGAPTGGSYAVALAPAGAPDDVVIQSIPSDGGSGSELLTLPIEPATFEARFVAYLGTGTKVLGRSDEFTSQAVEASISAPAEVRAGSQFEVHWEGPDLTGDFVAVVTAGGDEGALGDWRYTEEGSPVTMRAPEFPGEYELRYVVGRMDVPLARQPLIVTAVDASIGTDREVPVGTRLQVSWTGPDNEGDYLGIVRAGGNGDEVLELAYTSDGSPLSLRAPAQPGEYEIRYVTGRESNVLATAPLTTTAAAASLDVPAEAVAGSDLLVRWTGPDNENDYVTIVPAGTMEGTFGAGAYTSDGNPVTIILPGETGEYEVRYLMGQDSSTMARASLTIKAVEASLSAPASVAAGEQVEVTWTGPDYGGDFITIVPAGSSEGTWANYAYTSDGNPVYIAAPDEPGEYEIRYALRDSYATVAAIGLTVR